MSKGSVSESEMSGSYDEEEYDSEMSQEQPMGREVETKNLLNYESDDSDDESDEDGMSDGEQVLGNKALNKRKVDIKEEVETWGQKKKSYYQDREHAGSGSEDDDDDEDILAEATRLQKIREKKLAKKFKEQQVAAQSSESE